MITKEIEYRTYEQLLDSVKLDFYTYDIENMISNQTLIKVAQKINRELGLKIHPSKGKVIDLVNGKAKLPNDLKVLNFVLLCDGYEEYELVGYPYSYKTYADGVLDGKFEAQSEFNAKAVKQFTQYVDIIQGDNVIEHKLGTDNIVVQVWDNANNLLSLNINVTNRNSVTIISNSNYENAKVVVIGSNSSYGIYCPPVEDPLCPPQPELVQVEIPVCPELDCNPNGIDSIAYRDDNKIKKYRKLVQLHIESRKTDTFDEVNTNSQRLGVVTVKNGYIIANFKEAVLFINYQGEMEDDEGNLLVLDHELVNDYYEYSLKERICENLIANGEPAQQLYSMMMQQKRKAKIDAITFIRTPNFKEMYKAWQMNRKAMYSKYYKMFI
jgi:hypothetical protein